MTDKPKRPRDANQLAKFIVDVAAGDEPEVFKVQSDPLPKVVGYPTSQLVNSLQFLALNKLFFQSF